MPWARFEDRYPANRKVRPLSDTAFRLDVTAVCWSSEQLTDGHVADLADLVGVKRPEKAAAELVSRGRWHLPGHTCPSPKCPPIVDGWLIHDYLVYNPSREKVLTEREAKAKRQAKWLEAKRRGDASTDGSRDASQDALETALETPTPSRETLTPPRPAPPRPEGGGGGTPPSRRASATTDPSGAVAEAEPQPAFSQLPPFDPEINARGIAAAREALNGLRRETGDAP